MRGLFVTGTDTGVGKTTFSAGLLRTVARRGARVFPFKPVETGCLPDPADALLLHSAARSTAAITEVCPIRLPVPVAPAAAAALAGTVIDIDALVAHAARASHGDPVLVETAGGLLVPYAPRVTGVDLAARFGLPIVVVARAALGTINHTALTVAELRRRNLDLAGIVLVTTSPDLTPDLPTNATYIEELTGVRPLGTVPYLSPADRHDPERLADAVQASVRLAPLLALLGQEPARA